MALPSKYSIEKKINSMEGLSAYENGGKGSGNFGHAGRPGEVGGSASSGGGASSSTKYTKADQIKDQYKAGLITESEMKGLIDKAEKDGSAKDEVKKTETKKQKNTEAMPNKKSQESATAWAKKNFTSGEQITDKDMSFDEVLARMVDGEDYYKFMGSDSVDREAMFSEMAKRTGLDYDDIYSAWMGDRSGQARRYIGELTRSPRHRELKQRDSAGFDAWRKTGTTDKFLNPKERDEKGLRDMVSSVWTYGGGKDSKYLHDGFKSLSDKERKKIIDDEWKYLDDNCTTSYAGEDSEGGSYRSIKYRPSDKKKKNSLEDVLTDTLDKLLNGGKGSGNFGHEGRPGKVGGSGNGKGGGLSGISKAIATQKKFQDQAKVVQEDIEDRIGQKVKKGEEYTALDEASKSRFKEFHGEDGTEYTYDKENGMITETNPETGDQEVVTKQKKDYYSERSGVNFRDGHRIASEFADLSAKLETARTNLKVMKEDSGKAYEDLAGRSRYLTGQTAIARAYTQAKALGKSKLSAETKKLVKEMESELKQLWDDYTDLGTKKYFDPDMN